MKTAIDNAGRVVIPKPLREAAGLKPGTQIEIRAVDAHLELEAVPEPVKLRHRGRLLVAVPEMARPALLHDEVEKTAEEVRRGRGRAAGA